MKDYSQIYNGSGYVSIYSKEGRNLLKRYVKKYKNKDFSISQSQFTDIQSAGELPGSLAATENQSLLRSIIEDHEPKNVLKETTSQQQDKESSVREPSLREPSVHGGEPSVHEPSIREPSIHGGEPSVREPSVHGGEPSVHEPSVHEPSVHEPSVHEEVPLQNNKELEENYEERSCTIC